MLETSFSYFQTSDGARLRYTYWPSQKSIEHCRGTVVIFQGRGSFIEKFISIACELTRQGFHVWAFDWRGQGLSTRLLKDRRRGYINSYETYLSDFHDLFVDIIAPKSVGPLIILGQSMGSHLALRYLVKHPDSFNAAVLTAPMLDLNTGGYSNRIARFFVRGMCRLGLGHLYVPGHHQYDPSCEPFEGNMLTHDRISFMAHRNFLKKNPNLLIGGVTFGWVNASFDSIAYLNQPEILGHITCPVLTITAGNEVIVDNRHVPKYVSWLPKGDYLNYEGARHQLLSESSFYMQRFWKDFSEFLEKNKKTIIPLNSTKRRLVKPPQFTGMKRVYPTLPNDFNRLEPNR